MRFFKILILAVAILQSYSEIYSQNVFKDDFNYSPADSLEGTGGWYRSGVNSNYNIKVVSPGLTYAGYAGSGLGNTAYISNSGEGDVLFHNLNPAITAGAGYMSFMLRIDSLPGTMTQGYCICFNPNTGGTNLNTRMYIKRLTGTTFNFGIYKSYSVTYNNTVYNSNTTYLVVLKYSIVAGNNNDSSKIYVFNSGVPASEPSVPLAFAMDSADYTGQGYVCLSNNYAQTGLRGCSIKIDGIRVGNSWSTSVLSSVRQISNEIPALFSLKQNYPNTFNPVTKISYELPESGPVTLKIYDALGNEVQTLVNENQIRGIYETEWNASGFASGVYFCRLESGGNSVSRNMMLIK